MLTAPEQVLHLELQARPQLRSVTTWSQPAGADQRKGDLKQTEESRPLVLERE